MFAQQRIPSGFQVKVVFGFKALLFGNPSYRRNPIVKVWLTPYHLTPSRDRKIRSHNEADVIYSNRSNNRIRSRIHAIMNLRALKI